MGKVKGFKEQELNIDDQIIDTESNLWYLMLQKNFLIGKLKFLKLCQQ